MSTRYVIHQEPGIDTSIVLMQKDGQDIVFLGESVKDGEKAVTDLGLFLAPGDTIEVNFEPILANTRSGKVAIQLPKLSIIEEKPLGNFVN